MIAIYDLIVYLIKNPVFTFICAAAGLIGFVLTVYVFFKTQNIDQQLRQLRTKQLYNQNREIYHSKLNGYTQNLLDDNVQRLSFYKEILKTVSELQANYSNLFSFKDKITIYVLKKYLRQETIDKNKVANSLTELAARLTKQEDEKL